ncbi:hypothetical protein [Blastococcus deserti]|uniref:Uncharacterized protein n=1 Tax=Blastococcus deserti TaxID=2259033 RepID=A0ABW4XH64_9ACTN
MTYVSSPQAPGGMTVPLLFGWQHILAVLLVLVAVAVVFLLIGATGAGGNERSEWQAWLDARAGRRADPAGEPLDDPAEPVGSEPR